MHTIAKSGSCAAKPKRKLRRGKKRMRQFGKVDIPQEVLIAALKIDS